MKRSEKREIREVLRKHFGTMVLNAELPEEAEGWADEAAVYAAQYQRELARGLTGQLSGLPESS